MFDGQIGIMMDTFCLATIIPDCSTYSSSSFLGGPPLAVLLHVHVTGDFLTEISWGGAH
jgi:hypothetical protein